VNLVGHDWGGYAGFLLAMEEPECVTAYLACSTPVPWLRPSPRLALQVWRSWYAFVLAAVGGPLLSRRPETIAERIRGPGLSEKDAKAYADLLARPDSAHATEQLYRSYLRSLVRLTSGGDGERGRLTAPTRVLLGTRDPAVAREFVEGDHSGHADQLEVELVEGAHHFVPEERPELVAERALELFARG
jgi:pimeloyl-ACP methyl ester carboxylesterase